MAVPTLCMVGDLDRSMPPALVAELAGLVPGASLVAIAGAGHLPCVEQREAVAAAMLGFFEEIDLG
jgi:3-oxoadipate enol-lactonase